MNPKKLENLGNLIKKLREAKGLKIKDIAEATGTSSYIVKNWERGRAEPTGESLLKLLNLLGIELSDLLEAVNEDVDPEDLMEANRKKNLSSFETSRIYDKTKGSSTEKIRV